VSAASGRHGLRILEHQEVDLILVNIFMPDMDSVELIQALRTTRPTTKIIAITARKGLRNFIDMAKHLGADDTLEKPFTRQELLSVIALQLGQPNPTLLSEDR
jgi:DNA-binding response OmpR family regulator